MLPRSVRLQTYRPSMHLVSGPQGSRVVLDGRPVLLLCSNNALGLADHPRVREAAADAAMRWGVGAGGSRLAAGTMTVHRRLEQRLAAFHDTDAALLFGSGALAGLGVLQTLAGPGDVVFADELNGASLADGCDLCGADVVVYRHADAEHLAWSISRAGDRAGVIVTESLFGMDGDVAPLVELADLAHEHRLRLVVDEGHALGTTGPDGRGLVAELQLEDEVDVVLGTLGAALGSYGGFAACDRPTARALADGARSLAASTAPPPPAIAGALAALELLVEQPRRIEKLQANARVLRDALAREGFDVAGAAGHIVALVPGDADVARRLHEEALRDAVFTQAVVAPDVPEGTARLRLTAMASHTKPELRDAARVLGRAALRAGYRPDAGMPVAAAHQATDELPELPAAEAA